MDNNENNEEHHFENDENMNQEENNNRQFDYNSFMNMSSTEYMLQSTLDMMETFQIVRELQSIFTKLDDWDRIVLYYAYELMQRNMQIAYKLCLYLFRSSCEDLTSQIMYWGLLLYCLSNVQTAYAYLIYRVYLLDENVARKLHEYLKGEFMFFEKSDPMFGTFNDVPLQRVTRYNNNNT